jgi:hypothetical protein
MNSFIMKSAILSVSLLFLVALSACSSASSNQQNQLEDPNETGAVVIQKDPETLHLATQKAFKDMGVAIQKDDLVSGTTNRNMGGMNYKKREYVSVQIRNRGANASEVIVTTSNKQDSEMPREILERVEKYS